MEKVKVTLEDVETGKKITMDIVETEEGAKIDIDFGGDLIENVSKEESLRNGLFGVLFNALEEGSEETEYNV